MSFTDNLREVTGEPVRADGWYGQGDHLYTVAIYVSNFQGVVYIEGSLAVAPGPNDWFNVIDPVVFGIGPDTLKGNETVGLGYTFRKNVTWIRARMDRPNVLVPPEYQETIGMLYGVVDRILLKR